MGSDTSSILDIINLADNLPSNPGSSFPKLSPDGYKRYVPFHLSSADFEADITPMGLLRPMVLIELQQSGSNFLVFHKLDKTDEVICVTFGDHVLQQGVDEMGRLLQETAILWRNEGKFLTQLRGKH